MTVLPLPPSPRVCQPLLCLCGGREFADGTQGCGTLLWEVGHGQLAEDCARTHMDCVNITCCSVVSTFVLCHVHSCHSLSWLCLSHYSVTTSPLIPPVSAFPACHSLLMHSPTSTPPSPPSSACTSASLEPSYVLRAIGSEEDLAHSSIR